MKVKLKDPFAMYYSHMLERFPKEELTKFWLSLHGLEGRSILRIETSNSKLIMELLDET